MDMNVLNMLAAVTGGPNQLASGLAGSLEGGQSVNNVFAGLLAQSNNHIIQNIDNNLLAAGNVASDVSRLTDVINQPLLSQHLAEYQMLMSRGENIAEQIMPTASSGADIIDLSDVVEGVANIEGSSLINNDMMMQQAAQVIQAGQPEILSSNVADIRHPNQKIMASAVEGVRNENAIVDIQSMQEDRQLGPVSQYREDQQIVVGDLILEPANVNEQMLKVAVPGISQSNDIANFASTTTLSALPKLQTSQNDQPVGELGLEVVAGVEGEGGGIAKAEITDPEVLEQPKYYSKSEVESTKEDLPDLPDRDYEVKDEPKDNSAHKAQDKAADNNYHKIDGVAMMNAKNLNSYNYVQNSSLQHSTLEQIKVQMAHVAKTGDNSISIQLHPAELGKLEIQLDIQGNGKGHITFTADKLHTLDMLQKDARNLERVLTDIGFKADTTSMSFSLNHGNNNQHNSSNGHEQNDYSASGYGYKEGDGQLEQVLSYNGYYRNYDKLDVRV